jgi:hypothetical protein
MKTVSRICWSLAFAMSVLAGSAPARAASIGVFADPHCTDCDLDIPLPPGIDTLYVTLSTLGLPWYAGQDQIAVHFKLDIPVGWYVAATPASSANFVIGDPLGPDGVSLYYWGRHLAGDCIPLYRLAVVPAMPGLPGEVRVVSSGFQHPWCAKVSCPKVVYEVFEPWCECVQGGTAFINAAGSCTVAVQPGSWSQIKRLYD